MATPDQLPSRLEITPARGPVEGTIRPPGSKSITNRSLVCAALADGISTLEGALLSEDTEVMIESLRRLGSEIVVAATTNQINVTGCGGRIPRDHAELFVGNSGTTMRFLTPLAALGHGRFTLDGVPRMRQRPMGDLVAALRQLGVDLETQSPGGCPPVVIKAAGLKGGRVTMRGDVSSQFLSGLLLTAPCAMTPVELELEGPLVSKPYVHMTLAVMRCYGAVVEQDGLNLFRVTPQSYRSCQYEIEPDASAASYFWAAAAITGGRVTVEGLSRGSLQGDIEFCDCLVRMGCRADYEPNGIILRGGPLHGIDVDMNAISDTVQTLAVVALFADGPTTIRGVGHIRHKETDRIGDLAAELRKLGAKVQERKDGLRIEPGSLLPAELETYNDHRMAMSLALAGLVQPGVVIRNPQCTAKTYPRFFADLARLVRG